MVFNLMTVLRSILMIQKILFLTTQKMKKTKNGKPTRKYSMVVSDADFS
jgi:hypothetical protein